MSKDTGIISRAKDFKAMPHSRFVKKPLYYPTQTEIESDASGSRAKLLLSRNPKFNLTNTLAQKAISAAETEDNEEFKRIELALLNPFDELSDLADYNYDHPNLDAAVTICVSCSS